MALLPMKAFFCHWQEIEEGVAPGGTLGTDTAEYNSTNMPSALAPRTPDREYSETSACESPKAHAQEAPCTPTHKGARIPEGKSAATPEHQGPKTPDRDDQSESAPDPCAQVQQCCTLQLSVC